MTVAPPDAPYRPLPLHAAPTAPPPPPPPPHPGWPVFAKAGIFVAHPDFTPDPAAYVAKLASYGFGWCAIYAHQGLAEQNAGPIMQAWLAALRAHSIRPGIWGFLETAPAAEAQLASDLIAKYDGPGSDLVYIADAEALYTAWGGDAARSTAFVKAFRALRPKRSAMLTSYGAAAWDNSLATVFDYKPWQAGPFPFEFAPQAYLNTAAELEPRHCIDQAILNGWPITAVHPVVATYTSAPNDPVPNQKIDGDQWSYLLRNLAPTKGTVATRGWSVFNAEDSSDADLAALSRIA